VRITIGTQEHTAAGIRAMEASLAEIEWTGEEA
jgi:hypothetical protein